MSDLEVAGADDELAAIPKRDRGSESGYIDHERKERNEKSDKALDMSVEKEHKIEKNSDAIKESFLRYPYGIPMVR